MGPSRSAPTRSTADRPSDPSDTSPPSTPDDPTHQNLTVRPAITALSPGPVRPEMKDVQDLRPSELLAAGVLTAGILLLGVFPAGALDLMAASVTRFSSVFAGI